MQFCTFVINDRALADLDDNFLTVLNSMTFHYLIFFAFLQFPVCRCQLIFLRALDAVVATLLAVAVGCYGYDGCHGNNGCHGDAFVALGTLLLPDLHLSNVHFHTTLPT